VRSRTFGCRGLEQQRAIQRKSRLKPASEHSVPLNRRGTVVHGIVSYEGGVKRVHISRKKKRGTGGTHSFTVGIGINVSGCAQKAIEVRPWAVSKAYERKGENSIAKRNNGVRKDRSLINGEDFCATRNLTGEPHAWAVRETGEDLGGSTKNLIG